MSVNNPQLCTSDLIKYNNGDEDGAGLLLGELVGALWTVSADT